MDKFRNLALGALLMDIPGVEKTEHHLILRFKNEDCKIEHRNGVYIVFTNDGPKRYETEEQVAEYLNITFDSIMQKVANDPALSRHLIAGIAAVENYVGSYMENLAATETGTNEANTTDNATAETGTNEANTADNATTETGTNEANTADNATTEKVKKTRKRNDKKSE